MYFDPGMGSLIIQTIIAGIAVIGGYLAYVKSGLKGMFTKKKKDLDETTEMNVEKKTNEDDDEL